MLDEHTAANGSHDGKYRPSFHVLVNFVKEAPKVYGIGVFLAVVAGSLEFIGVTSLIPILATITGEEITGVPTFIQSYLSFFTAFQVFTFVASLILVQACLAFIRDFYFIRQISVFRTKLSLEYIRKITYSEWGGLGKLEPGEVEVMLTRDIASSMKIRYLTANLTADIVLSMIYIFIIVSLSRLTFVLICMVFLIFLIIHKFTLKYRVDYSLRARERFIRIARKVIEYFTDARTLIISNKESFLRLLRYELNDAAHVLARTDQINAFFRSIHQPILLFSFFLAAGVLLLFDQKIATLGGIFYIFYRSAPHLVNVIRGYGEILGDSVIDVVPQIKRWNQYVSKQAGIAPQDVSIQFQNVDLWYNNENPLLKNVNITIQSNEFVCIVGKSGSGKSTILDVICGFHKSQAGSVLLGKVDSSQVDWHLWRKKIGLLRAESVVVSGTWVDNVAFLDDTPNPEKVKKILDQVGLTELLQEYSDGVHSLIVARGANLSAGQRQRLLLARALYREPELLILDEPTSNLDVKTEMDICSLLARLKGNLTIIVVSHRDSLLSLANYVYTLTDNRALIPLNELTVKLM